MISAIAALLICTFMGAISYGLGILPLHLDVNNHIKPVSLFSGGLLIGAALCLAIPESIENYTKNAKNDSKWIGISVMLGFVSMILVDQNYQKPERQEISINDYDVSPPPSSIFKSILHTSLTLALLIHSAIDGISLGSAFHRDSITFVFSLVVIIHKLPTCFSLSCLLLQKGVNAEMVKIHILAFALTTPLFAILTWIALLAVNPSDTVIGILLLFSSGTFIYISTHILGEFKEMTFTEMGILIVGILVPGFLSFMH
ncbi:hypothetical protein PSN45_004643 [Yamadazyma tenuis]|uniref:Zinc/iron permease n=1 Tax=Candida tenuis (strain ATCC 10573 / BCRC 21748 / CBS 615 / JCM 9827 / NBRC 10315 / NRRL Y-1498 / VKM Y-70) TaxID=590646 RepID=G3B736_CANTC|nr:uncharacterized protein CANTEDRAFT_106582 [Yamadazyma tenuis ATCC 10573]EGV63088.1 hypothetical protein CANTEDRAFT_106582 [Yamadazyma tenuis ATCC 10573]WEJ97095.1 hypothetical protein PSN45_004643 [Yamadazyma tenuis]